jgi:4'-phosphopantetheinyl transferase
MKCLSSLHRQAIALNEIHLWHADIDQESSRLKIFERLLDEDESARARRFYHSTDRCRYITRRGMLRLLIGSYAACEPSHIAFSYTENGKPCIARPVEGRCINFNVSHSEGFALFAFVKDSAIGADIEKKRRVPDMIHIAQKILTEKEYCYFKAVPDCEKGDVFFRFWTHKEALVKAMGCGLSFPLTSIELGIEIENENKIFHNYTFPGIEKRWTVLSYAPASEYCACVVVENSDVDQKIFSQCTMYSVNDMLHAWI